MPLFGKKEPKELPGGWKVKDLPYFTGSGQTFSSGDKVVHGQQGEVVGPGNHSKGESVKVLFPGNKGAINCYLTEVSREPPPPLPGGWKLKDLPYYTGGSRTWEQAGTTFKLVHGQRGEVVGPATAESHKGKGVCVLFPGNTTSINCLLTEVSREPPADKEAQEKAEADKEAKKEAAARAAKEAAEKAAAATPSPAAPPTPDPAPASAPALSGEEALRAKLAELNLSQFADKLVNEGVDSLETLADVDDAQLGEIGMGMGHKIRVKKMLAALQASSPSAAPAAPEEDKFFAKKLVMGQAAEAAHGLVSALGLTDAELGAQLQRGEQAIVDEFTAHGSAEDKANLQYVLRGTALKEEDLPAHVQQQIHEHKYHGGVLETGDFDHGHGGKTLADFVNHEYSRLAQLLRPHVLALRMYTSSSYPCFNRPLRERKKPHPFAMAVYYLADGLKKLRAVAAQIDPAGFTQEVVLWRGMQDLTLDQDEFTTKGGTELAPMSTSRSKSVAFKYASSRAPLVFKYKTRGLGRGCSIGYLSLYPKEEEYLYPPLTYLLPERVDQEQGYKVVEVAPQMS